MYSYPSDNALHMTAADDAALSFHLLFNPSNEQWVASDAVDLYSLQHVGALQRSHVVKHPTLIPSKFDVEVPPPIRQKFLTRPFCVPVFVDGSELKCAQISRVIAGERFTDHSDKNPDRFRIRIRVTSKFGTVTV